jgi:hypothetical protein
MGTRSRRIANNRGWRWQLVASVAQQQEAWPKIATCSDERQDPCPAVIQGLHVEIEIEIRIGIDDDSDSDFETQPFSACPALDTDL